LAYQWHKSGGRPYIFNEYLGVIPGIVIAAAMEIEYGQL
jgi:hypothetical protein